MTDTIRVKCNQNRLFGCGRFTPLPVVRYVIGESRRRLQAGGRCQHCNLPLAVVRDDPRSTP